VFSKGLLYVISGPMFAGKTSELLRFYDRTIYGNQRSILVKPSLDNRYSDCEVSTHDSKKRESFVLNNIEDLSSIIEKEHPENVFIDEAQFFSTKILKIVDELRKSGINVYCSLLNQTSEGKAFPFLDKKENVGELLVMADHVKTLNAVCPVCGKNATKTFKLESSGQEVDVGGSNKYEPRCYEHWEPKK
jgi:thymidine kinase